MATLKSRRKWIAFALLSIAVSLVLLTVFRITAPSRSQTNGTMNFNFTWGPEAQGIVAGTFKIDVTVWFVDNPPLPGSNTSIKIFYMNVSVPDDDYSSNDYLGFVLDMNQNGIIDYGINDNPFIFYPNNTTIVGMATTLHKDGSVVVAEVPRFPAPNKCRYDSEKGYVFGPFGYQASEITTEIQGGRTYIPIHMCFYDANRYLGVHIVSVQFRIYLTF